MVSQYSEIKPLFEIMDEKIHASEFYDIIENKTKIWMLNDTFKKNNSEFYDIMKNSIDSELVFDKIECKKNLENYIS